MKIMICFFFSFYQLGAQSWQQDAVDGAVYLEHLYVSRYDDALKIDSNMVYIFTYHMADKFWKKNKVKKEFIVSKVDKDGNVSFIKKLEPYLAYSLKRNFNGKYYLLSKSSITRNGMNYLPLCIYGRDWQLEKQVLLPGHLPEHQLGFKDLIVGKEENIYLVTSPYFIDHKPEDLTGCYLIKADSSGNFIKRYFIEASFAKGIQLVNDTLSLTAYKQKMILPHYHTDSVINLQMDRSLNLYRRIATRVQENRNYSRTLDLRTGDKAIIIDSIIPINATANSSSRKIAMDNKTGQRMWTYEMPNNFLAFYSTEIELRRGGFLVQVLKKQVKNSAYDTVGIMQFDRRGNKKDIKMLLDGANPRMENISIAAFFETRENEVGVFYQKNYPNMKQRVYFEKILLSK